MQNLKYLQKAVDEEERFGVLLNQYAQKHTEHIQLKIALTLLEFFNGGKFVDERDIEVDENTFYVPKSKYFLHKKTQQSRVFSIRVNLDDSEEEVEKKITKLQKKVEKYRNSK